MAGASFISLLFVSQAGAANCRHEEPAYFIDLNLDQMVSTIVGKADEYDLRPLLYSPAPDRTTIARRHAVFQDFDNPPLQAAVTTFLDGLKQVHKARKCGEKARYRHEKSHWLLDALNQYCDVVARFTDELGAAGLQSDAFRELTAYLVDYVNSGEFETLRETTQARLDDLASVRYTLHINMLHVAVGQYEDEVNYSDIIARTFERFRGGESTHKRQKFSETLELNQVEAQVLAQVVKLYPALFARVDAYVAEYHSYMDAVVARINRELRFYLYYQHYIAPLKKAGLPFCLPQIMAPGETISANGAYDLVLAHKLTAQNTQLVTNDFELHPPERLIVVSGPNQGGKTTFARMFGQLHHLATLGVPVPARQAALLFWRVLATHFERAEDIHNLRGKLEDDLVRIHDILEQVDRESIIIMNEIFSSTTTADARYLGERILRALLAAETISVCVTFIDDLAKLDQSIVSMASTVDDNDPAIRTFKIIRKPPDGKAHARALAAKHRLTRTDLEARL